MCLKPEGKAHVGMLWEPRAGCEWLVSMAPCCGIGGILASAFKCSLFVGDPQRVEASKVLTWSLGHWDHKALLQYAVLMLSV